MNKIRVLITNDHTIIRQGLSALLESESDLEVIGEASNAPEAIELAKKLRPDVVLMDAAMWNDTARHIKTNLPLVKVLVMTMRDNEEMIFQVLKAGASGHPIKDSAMTDLVSAIRAVQQGTGPFISRRVIEEYIRRTKLGEKAWTEDPLSNREREVLRLIAEGNSVPQIASLLSISKRTVETYKNHIVRKLNIRDKAGLIKYAIRMGLTKL